MVTTYYIFWIFSNILRMKLTKMLNLFQFCCFAAPYIFLIWKLTVLFLVSLSGIRMGQVFQLVQSSGHLILRKTGFGLNFRSLKNVKAFLILQSISQKNLFFPINLISTQLIWLGLQIFMDLRTFSCPSAFWEHSWQSYWIL